MRLGSFSFVNNFSTDENHLNTERKERITPSKYLHCRLKWCDDRFTSDLWYTSTVQFTERKQFQTDITVDRLQNQDKVMYMISNDQIFVSFKSIRGAPQYFHNIFLDVLAKIRQYSVRTFFPLFSAAEFEWPYIIQVTTCQYGEELSEEQINTIDLGT